MSQVRTEIADAQVQSPSVDDVYDDGYLRIEHKNYYVACAGRSIRLSRTEFLIISRLARSVERAVSTQDLWNYIWESRKPLNAESLHVHIYRLRNRLLPYQLHIDTMVNVGYRLLTPAPSEAKSQMS